MASMNQKWVAWLLAIAVLGAIIVIAAATRRPQADAPEAPPKPACLTAADCPAGHECVAPGRCSQVCKSDRDCPEGRTCAELRAMAPTDATPTTVMTCVVATPR